MHPTESAIMTWLWMEAAQFGIKQLIWANCIHFRLPGKSWEYEADYQRKTLQYCLNNWKECRQKTISHQSGQGSGHTETSIGWDTNLSAKGIVARFRHLEVSVSWNEVKAVTEAILTQDKQITLFELLAGMSTKQEEDLPDVPAL